MLIEFHRRDKFNGLARNLPLKLFTSEKAIIFIKYKLCFYLEKIYSSFQTI